MAASAASSPSSLHSSLSSPRHSARAFDGFTSSGERFVVPATLDTVATLLPQHWSLTSVLTLALIAVNAACVACMRWSKWPHLLYFLFFRISYDVGLGLILRSQSRHGSFTAWYEAAVARAGGVKSSHWAARVLHHLTQSQLVSSRGEDGQQLDVDLLPAAFRSWLLFKNLVNLILINDGCNYLLLAVKCAHLPEHITALVLLQYATGAFLALFNCQPDAAQPRTARQPALLQ